MSGPRTAGAARAPGSAPAADEDMSAAEARSAHSIASAVRSAVTVWFALLGAVAAWVVHLVALAGLAGAGCTSADARLAMHAVTLGCVVVAGAAIGLSARLARRSPGDEGGADSRSRARFLGLLGLVIGVIHLALILAEEVDVVVFAGGPCG